MKNRIFAILLLSFSTIASIQAQKTSTFPDTWSGQWTGDLEIYSGTGLLQKVPMALNIQPTDSSSVYTWELIYGSGDKQSVRPYKLMVVDREKGQYLIDENNSIILQGYLLGGKFYNRFKVGDNLLLTTTELLGDNLIFEVISGKSDAIKTTGGQVVDGEEVPPVDGYEIMVRQKAVLKKE